MAQIYRKSALEKISSPEQLDKALVITSPASWLVLIGITLIIVVTVVWSIIGTIPVTVSAPGIISSPESTNAIYAEDTGKVVAVMTRAGNEVTFGDVICTYQTNDNEVVNIFSNQVGTVSQVLVKNGDTVTPGSEVVSISPTVKGAQVAVCYIPLSQAKKVERGMDVQIYLDSVDSQTYGYMYARVINIDSHVATNTGMARVLGSDNNLASTFQKDGAVVAITCEFYLEDSTESGYDWSNEKGASIKVSNGSSLNAKIITEEVAPITKLFSKLKEIWGE